MSEVRGATGARTGVRAGVIAALVVVTGGIAWALFGGADGESGRGEDLTFTVRRGPLVIDVSEGGTIKALDQEIIKSQVEGQTTIIYLVPEGTNVEKGTLLVELDTSNLEDRKLDQQIKVQASETAFIRARESLDVVKSQAVSDIAQAQLDYRFAEEDLQQYQEGEFPKLLKEADAKITLEEQELENATRKLEWSERLLEEKYISQTEFEADRLARSRAELDHQLAVANRDLLKEYTYTRRVDELQSAIAQTKRALDRVQLRANSDIVQAQADLDNKEAELEKQRSKLKKIEDQIAKANIYAPVDGMVVYATSSRASWRGNAEPLDEGQTVRERQELIHLPTTAAMMAEIKLHESNLEKVTVDMPVAITVDALPGHRYQGRVTKIAPLPDAQSMWMNPDLKVYRTEIQVEGSTEGLRTGMSCRAEIVVARYSDAVQVPIQSIVRVAGAPTAYVVENGAPTARAVEIGLDNNRMVHVTKGLAQGDVVLLAPPLTDDESTAPAADGASQEPPIAAAEEGGAAGAAVPEEGGAAGAAVPEVPAGHGGAGPGRGSRDGEMSGPRPGGGRERGERGGRREGGRRSGMSEEQRAALRERFERMTPEEREAMRKRWSGGGGRSRPGGSGGPPGARDSGRGHGDGGSPGAGGQRP